MRFELYKTICTNVTSYAFVYSTRKGSFSKRELNKSVYQIIYAVDIEQAEALYNSILKTIK